MKKRHFTSNPFEVMQMKNKAVKRPFSMFFLFLLLAVFPVISHPAIAHAQEVLRARLSNGLRVVIIRDPLVPVVTTAIN